MEGDFPYARHFSIGAGSPSDNSTFCVSGDGSCVPEVVFLDRDIPVTGSNKNPYVPDGSGALVDRFAAARHYKVYFEINNGDPVTLNSAPPYRKAPTAPNADRRFAGSHVDNGIGRRGPYIVLRTHLPDGYDPLGGVEPPKLTLQFPGQAPVLAPVSRDQELHLGELIPPYTQASNPVLGTDGTNSHRSRQEQRAMDVLRRRAFDALDAAKPANQVGIDDGRTASSTTR